MTAPGLCGRCRHARTITSRRGSMFWLCDRSGRDPDYPRYPRLPVVRCPGFEVAGEDAGGTRGDPTLQEQT